MMLDDNNDRDDDDDEAQYVSGDGNIGSPPVSKVLLLVEVCCLVFNKLETLIFAARPVILFIATMPSLMSVHVWWNSTNNNTGVKILDYRVMLIDTVTQEERIFSKITALSLYINNLKHNRTYLIKVQAENDDGYGRFKIKAFKTLEAG